MSIWCKKCNLKCPVKKCNLKCPVNSMGEESGLGIPSNWRDPCWRTGFSSFWRIGSCFIMVILGSTQPRVLSNLKNKTKTPFPYLAAVLPCLTHGLHRGLWMPWVKGTAGKQKENSVSDSLPFQTEKIPLRNDCFAPNRV